MRIVFGVFMNKPHSDCKTYDTSNCGHQGTFNFIWLRVSNIIKEEKDDKGDRGNDRKSRAFYIHIYNL